MAPKSPWSKKATGITNVQRGVAASPSASPPINYNEVQIDEIEVLKAIYMGDFEEVEIKSAWSKLTDRSFKLKLKSNSDEETFVSLSVQLTATYPKTAPLLDVQNLQSYHERTQERIRNIVQNRPKQLLGEVMIHAIASEIQDALEDAIQARQQGTLPSLEDERASAEEVANVLAKEAEETEARRQREAQEEEDRILKQMVDVEINRREKRRPSKPLIPSFPSTIAGNALETITFDQSAALQIGSEIADFSQVAIVAVLSQKRDEQLLLGKSSVSSDAGPSLVAVKRLTFRKDRREIMEIESVLENTQKLRHSNILSIFGYRIDRLDGAASQLVLCGEYADRGSMRDLLELGSLHVNKARQFTTELLEALDYLHHNGVAHGSVNISSIAITGNPISPKLTGFGYAWMLSAEDSMSLKWRAPEGEASSDITRRKTDIWQFGVVVCQMFLGLQVLNDNASPQILMTKLDLSESFNEFLRKLFTVDVKKRPSAFDLLPAEFLRTDAPLMELVQSSVRNRRSDSSVGLTTTLNRHSRHNSSNAMEQTSRYANDFTEMSRLGKGGFGEVAKARNKLDGGVYAVKKIKQTAQLLDQVISEVMLLNRLNHPYVVRYFSTWVEENISGAIMEDSNTTTDTRTLTEDSEATTAEDPHMDFGYQSTGGLDFVSSSGYPQIEFGDDSDDESDDENDDEDSPCAPEFHRESAIDSAEPSELGELGLRKSRSESRRGPSTLYIQMEYCERQTLRDLIRKNMSSDDSWRYVRQITEGLAHIHGHGIIHRDLKPDNIFIDVAGNPKIGDFGLATTAQYHFTDKVTTMSGRSGGDMTRSVGTTLYVAPELRSASGTSYNNKVDMYSLGIIFYEMCEPFGTAMERIRAIQQVREKEAELPLAYRTNGEKAAQGKVISCLISHKSSDRPSSTELLRSDILPLKIEDETIRQALSGLSDPRSPYHQKMMSALFSQDSVNASRVKALAWDARALGLTEEANRLRLRSIARQTLESIFRRHGAEEARRENLFPRSGHYTNSNVVQLLDASGNVLQLPYDLTLPYARQLARQSTDVRCTFAFGHAYRDAFTGGPPRVNEEVDFDIVNSHDEDQSFDDAEVLKIMDEIVSEMPLFSAATIMSFNLNHATILSAVLDHCRVPLSQQPAVKEIISRLGFHQWTWSKVRGELRKFGLPDTTLDDLQQFDFRDMPEKAFERLRALLESANQRLQSKAEIGIRLLQDVVNFAAQFNVQRKIYVVPLGSVNAKFYEDGMLFQCVFEHKSNRIVVAAGGRYDSLIRAHASSSSRTGVQGAVGVAIGLDPIITKMSKNRESTSKKAFLKEQRHDEPLPKRCDVLVVASNADDVRSAGVRFLTAMWASDISAELVTDARAVNDKSYCFVVTFKHKASTTARVTSRDSDSEDADIPISALVGHLQHELRERESTKSRHPALTRRASHHHHEAERKSNVHVLLARHGSKKTNKYQIVGDAQQQWAQKLDEAKNAPILAVETRDDVLDLVQQTMLSDPESWRRAVQSVQLNDRQYVQQIHNTLTSWRNVWVDGNGSREACVFNFRTQHCIYYDLGS